MATEHDGLQLIPKGLGSVKLTMEIGAGGGVKVPALDLKAIAVNRAPPARPTVTVGAVPLVAAKFIPSL